MDQLRLQGMEAVDTVLALLRGVHDLNVLMEVVETLDLQIEEENRVNRRFVLRVITNYIESEEFDNLGDVAGERINNIQDRLNGFFIANLPPPPPGIPNAAGLAAPELENVVDGDDPEEDNAINVDLGAQPPVLQHAPDVLQQLAEQQAQELAQQQQQAQQLAQEQAQQLAQQQAQQLAQQQQ